MLPDTVMAVVCKATNLGGPFVFITADWPFAQETVDISSSGSAECINAKRGHLNYKNQKERR